MKATNVDVKPWVRGSSDQLLDQFQVHFFDPSQFEWVGRVESNWVHIRDELLSVLEHDMSIMEPYKDLSMTDKVDAWKTAGLMYWGFKSKPNIIRFPKTWEILREIPGLISCSLLALEPSSSVKPHNGDTNGVVRCHMGLVVPAELPTCGFRVGGESISWKHGKIFMFNDAILHTAWNNSDSIRYILSFDVIRPEYASKKIWISSRVLAQIYLEITYQNYPALQSMLDGNFAGRILLKIFQGMFTLLKIFRLSLFNLL